MIYLFDLSRTLLFPTDKNYTGGLNELHKKLSLEQNYYFWDNFYLDEDKINSLKKLKSEGNKLYMFTSGTIQNAPELRTRLDEIFIKIYSGEELGFSKKDADAYKFITKDIGINPDALTLIDDSKENREAAKAAGLAAKESL